MDHWSNNQKHHVITEHRSECCYGFYSVFGFFPQARRIQGENIPAFSPFSLHPANTLNINIQNFKKETKT